MHGIQLQPIQSIDYTFYLNIEPPVIQVPHSQLERLN